MKNKYLKGSVTVLKAEPQHSLLVGSVIPTITEVVITSEQITVAKFKVDNDFKDNGFGDISF